MERVQAQDLYEVLQVSPRAHPLIIMKVFRLLAALYHPDNKQTGDEEMFKQLAQAYQILSDPVRRAAYDKDRFGSMGPKNCSAPTIGSALGAASSGHDVDEPELRAVLLRALYDVRRGRPYKPSLSLLAISELVGCTVEALQYTLWYLRGKRFIETTEDSEVAITVDGVDYVEANGLDAHGSRGHQRIGTPLALPFDRNVVAEWSLAPTGKSNDNGSGNRG
jgi:curved DNA-binding protein CbpA